MSKLLSHLKHKGASKIVVFVDEKKFIVDAVVSRHNVWVIAIDPSEVPLVFHIKNPASVMVFGAVASDGSVIAILNIILLPWMEKRVGLDNVVLLQDSSPCHGSKITQTFRANNVPFFIKSDIWASNSPDLNVLDYFV